MRPANCCHLIPSNRFLDGFPDPSQLAAAKLTHYSTMPHRPSDASRPWQRFLMCTRILALLPSIHIPCVHATSQIVGRAISICAIVVLVGFEVFWQQSTVELRTGHAALAVPHPLHQYCNRFHHQLQLKLPIGIPSPFLNSMQMASATNRLN